GDGGGAWTVAATSSETRRASSASAASRSDGAIVPAAYSASSARFWSRYTAMAAVSSSGAMATWCPRNNGQSSMPSVNATSSVAMDQNSSIERVGQAIEECAAAACVAKERALYRCSRRDVDSTSAGTAQPCLTAQVTKRGAVYKLYADRTRQRARAGGESAPEARKACSRRALRRGSTGEPTVGAPVDTGIRALPLSQDRDGRRCRRDRGVRVGSATKRPLRRYLARLYAGHGRRAADLLAAVFRRSQAPLCVERRN